jgi:hypothetical protein
LEKALKSAATLTLHSSEEHGTERFGDLAIGKKRGNGKVHAFDFPGEGIPDDGVVEGSAGIDLALEVMAALRLCDSDGVTRNTVPEVIAVGAALQANGRVHRRDESLQA